MTVAYFMSCADITCGAATGAATGAAVANAVTATYTYAGRPLLPIQQFRCLEWALAASREATKSAIGSAIAQLPYI